MEPWAPTEPCGSSSVLEEQLNRIPNLDLRQDMPPAPVSKSFLSLLFQVLTVLLSVVGDVLVSVYREVCSIRFLFTAVSLLSVFLAALWWGLLYLVPPLENEPKEMLTLSQYHQRVHSQSQQLQQLQTELNKLNKEVSSVRAAHSEVRPCTGVEWVPALGWGGSLHWGDGGYRSPICIQSRLLWNDHSLGPESNLHPRYPQWGLFLKALKVLSLSLSYLEAGPL